MLGMCFPLEIYAIKITLLGTNSRMVDALVSRMDSMINLPWESITATEIVA